MRPKRPARPPISPLLKALRLWDRRARRGVLPPATLLTEWQTSVDAALREGSSEASELRLRLASIGGLVFGRGEPDTGTPNAGRRERDVGRLWQAVFDAPRRGTLGKLAERVAGQLSVLRNPTDLGDQQRLARSTLFGSAPGLQTTLTDEPDDRSLRSQDFLLARQSLAAGWLDRLGVFSRFGFQVGGYSRLDMPFVLDTELELDWLEGEPDPFEVPEVIGPARRMAERLVPKGARVKVTRGREVPVDAYEPSEARAAEDLSIAGAYGPVSLGSFSILDQAVPLEDRPGLLHLILAPGAVEAAKALPVVEIESTVVEPFSPDRPDPARETREPTTDVPPGSRARHEEPTPPIFAQRDLNPETLLPSPSPSLAVESPGAEHSPVGAGPRPVVQIAVDWVSGEDPWRDPEIIARATANLQARAGASARVEIVRGRELPFERYSPVEARASADLYLVGSSRPVPLTGITLLDGAIVELQRPGLLQVLLAPGSARVSGTQPFHHDDSAREYPELVLAREEADAVAVEEDRSDAGGERRVAWTADLGRRETPSATPAAVGGAVSRSGGPASSPSYGLLGARTFVEEVLGAGRALPLTADREPMIAHPQSPTMRVIDRQTEIRRAERAREAEVVAATGTAVATIDRPSDASPVVPSSQGGLPAQQASAVQPLSLPLVVDSETDAPESPDSQSDNQSKRGDVAERRQPGELAPSAPAAQSTPEGQPAPEGSTPPSAAETPGSSSPLTGGMPVEQSTLAAPLVQTLPSKTVTETSAPTDEVLPFEGAPLPTPLADEERSQGVQTEVVQAQPPAQPISERQEGSQPDHPADMESATAEATGPRSPAKMEAETAAPEESRPVTGAPPSASDGSSAPIARATSSPEAVSQGSSTGETIRITLDWISGEDPWANTQRFEQAREALRELEGQGVRIELVRGHEVPPGQYNPEQAQRAADFQMLTLAGPVLLAGLDLLDAAMLVAQRPGALEVILPPRGLAPTQPGEQYRGAPDLPLAIAEDLGEGEADAVEERSIATPIQRAAGPQPPPASQQEPAEPPVAGEARPSAPLSHPSPPEAIHALPDASPATPVTRSPSPAPEGGTTRPSEGETIRITLDWVSGEDPWADSRRLEPTHEAIRVLADQGVRVELVRGREVPGAQYNPGVAQRAADFQMLTAAGPIILAGLDLLDAAMLVAQRPGSLEVLLAPQEFAPTHPSEPYRGAPEMPLAIPPDEADGEADSVVDREGVAPIQREPAPQVAPAQPALASEQAPVMPDDATETLTTALPPGPSLPEVIPGIERPSLAAPPADRPADPGLAAADGALAPSVSGARAVEAEATTPAATSSGDRELSWLDLTVARSARRTQVVEITLDWIPGADPWAEPDQLEVARESARGLEDQGIRVVFRRGRELPAASYDAGQSLQPIDFSVVGPSGPVFLETLALLGGSNLISQRPGVIEVVLAPAAAASQVERALAMPELVYSEDADISGEPGEEQGGLAFTSPGLTLPRQATQPRPAEVGATAAAQTVQVVVDWVAGENPWTGLAERTAELVRRLEREGVHLEFVAGRPVSPAEYAEAPAQAAEAFFLPTDRGAVSLRDAAWLNQAVLRRQRPGLMHVLLAPSSVQAERRPDQRALPDLVFPSPEDAEPESGTDSTPMVARRVDSPSSPPPVTVGPPTIGVPPTQFGIPPREPLVPTQLPAARAETTLGISPQAPPMAGPLITQPRVALPASERAQGPGLEWPAMPDETSTEAIDGEAREPDVQVTGPRSPFAARRADRSGDVARPLAIPGEFAAELVQRTEDGLAPGRGAGATFPHVGDLDMGGSPAWSSGAGARPLWDNTAAMSVLVYDVTSVEGEADTGRGTGTRFGDWSSAPPIGSALTYIHEGRPAELGRETGPDRVAGYVIPSTLIYVSDGELMTAEPRQAARAAMDRQPVATGPTVQREVTEVGAPATEGAGAKPPNLEVLAREVYREIKWRLVVEHERAGTRRPTRGW